MLVSGQQYGFRCEENSLSVTLIRSFWDPDPFPELGKHRFDIGIGLVESTSSSALIAAAVDYGHPCSVVSATAHPGRLPAAGSLLELAGGSVALSAVKLAEEGGRRLVVRLSETDGRDTEATLRLSAPIAAAWLADVLERRLDGAPAATVEGQTVTIPVAAHTVVTVVVEMAAGS
jgi:alpha-mannosidase